MNKRLVAIVCSLGLGLTATSAVAAEIQLVVGSPPSYNTNYYVGAIDDVAHGESQELAFVGNLISVGSGQSETIGGILYDRTGSTLTTLPSVEAVRGKNDSLTLSDTSDVFAWTLNDTGTLYILAKYDEAAGGTLVFLATITAGDTVYVPDSFGGHDLSHLSVLGRVPDGGTTLMLLGGALVGLGALRRKFRT